MFKFFLSVSNLNVVWIVRSKQHNMAGVCQIMHLLTFTIWLVVSLVDCHVNFEWYALHLGITYRNTIGNANKTSPTIIENGTNWINEI